MAQWPFLPRKQREMLKKEGRHGLYAPADHRQASAASDGKNGARGRSAATGQAIGSRRGGVGVTQLKVRNRL